MDRPKPIGLVTTLVKRLKRKLEIILDISSEYRYGAYSIALPAGHMLPDYQKTHPNYDRFLPHLAEYLVDSEVVVDIGANVGDTLIAMYCANKDLCYICIEADDVFFRYLSENIDRIKAEGERIDVTTIKACVGKSVSATSLEGNGGTRHAVIGGIGSLRLDPLDKLIDQSKLQSVRLLKTDVDGFDWDVLDSADALIRLSKPIIYFEVQYDDESQYRGYLNTIKTLTSVGYQDWFIFDNFGSHLLRTDDMEVMTQLMSYLSNQNSGKSTRTIYYYDVLGVQKKDLDFISFVVEKYTQR